MATASGSRFWGKGGGCSELGFDVDVEDLNRLGHVAHETESATAQHELVSESVTTNSGRAHTSATTAARGHAVDAEVKRW